MKIYKIKEINLTLQGEGFYTGRPAVFVRFSGCNLWTGHDKDRESAICYWCDTNFVGLDGPNGGKYNIHQITNIIINLWEESESFKPYVVFTGGEPLLQLDEELINYLSDSGFETGVETNGTIAPPNGIDWICVSPKANTDCIIKKGNELKLVFPQCGINPRNYEKLEFEHFFLQPMDGKNQNENIQRSKDYIFRNPKWKISLQTHKIIGIP